MDATQISLLIGGPSRPPSKRQLAQVHADEVAARDRTRTDAAGGPSRRTAADGAVVLEGEEESYWAYMTRNVQERTERLGIMGDSVDRLEDNSRGWSEDVNKFVGRQKKNLVMGAIKRGIGF